MKSIEEKILAVMSQNFKVYGANHLTRRQIERLCREAARRGYEAGYHDCDRGDIQPRLRSKALSSILRTPKRKGEKR